MRFLKKLLRSILTIILLVAMGIAAFVNFAPTFGAAPSGESVVRIEASANYSDGVFHNLVPTALDTSSEDNPRSLTAFFSPPAGKNPSGALPAKALDLAQLTAGKFVWLGHSTVLFNMDGKFILSDPVFHRASPVPFIGEAFATQHSVTAADMPELDLVLISHDHYDHLDHQTVQELNSKTKRFFVPLGVGCAFAALGRGGRENTRIRLVPEPAP